MRLQGKTALIAGASRNIGKAIALAFAPTPRWRRSVAEWHQVFEVNLHSTFYLAKALAPSMMKHGAGGSIVAIGGMASLTAQPERAHVIAGDRMICAGGRYM